MKLANYLSLIVLSCLIFASGCMPLEENPMEVTNEEATASVTNMTVPSTEEIGDENFDPEIYYNPGLIHEPVIGCDTLITDLVVHSGPYTVTVGKVYITQTSHDLHFLVHPYSGLRIMKMAFYEGNGLNAIPVDKAGTPSPVKFDNQVSFQVPVVNHDLAIPMVDLLNCQAYCLFVQVVTVNANGGVTNSWGAWAWGHSVGEGFAMELCVPNCGAIIQV